MLKFIKSPVLMFASFIKVAFCYHEEHEEHEETDVEMSLTVRNRRHPPNEKSALYVCPSAQQAGSVVLNSGVVILNSFGM